MKNETPQKTKKTQPDWDKGFGFLWTYIIQNNKYKV